MTSNKKSVSLTLKTDNLAWLKSQASSSLSNAVDDLITKARKGESFTAPPVVEQLKPNSIQSMLAKPQSDTIRLRELLLLELSDWVKFLEKRGALGDKAVIRFNTELRNAINDFVVDKKLRMPPPPEEMAKILEKGRKI